VQGGYRLRDCSASLHVSPPPTHSESESWAAPARCSAQSLGGSQSPQSPPRPPPGSGRLHSPQPTPKRAVPLLMYTQGPSLSPARSPMVEHHWCFRVRPSRPAESRVPQLRVDRRPGSRWAEAPRGRQLERTASARLGRPAAVFTWLAQPPPPYGGRGVVTVWSQCGHGAVTAWARRGHGVVTAPCPGSVRPPSPRGHCGRRLGRNTHRRALHSTIPSESARVCPSPPFLQPGCR
jgi:hypothetical protein